MNYLSFANLQKPVTDVRNVVGAGRGPVAARPVVEKLVEKKHAPETVIVISSDEESEKSKPAVRRVSKEGSRKQVKTLTSILTARSKVSF